MYIYIYIYIYTSTGAEQHIVPSESAPIEVHDQRPARVLSPAASRSSPPHRPSTRPRVAAASVRHARTPAGERDANCGPDARKDRFVRGAWAQKAERNRFRSFTYTRTH